MTTTTAPQVTRPIAIGDSRDFPVAGTAYTMAVTRTDDQTYRVVVLDMHGHAIPCWTSTFTADNVPLDMTARRAAWTYMQTVAADLTAAAERPADLLARTAADYAAADLSRLSPAQQTALRAADAEGTIRRGNGITVATLKALAHAHVGLLVYTTTGMRRTVTAIQLNRHGRRLADHLTTDVAA